jgi:hypothetical protein
MSLRLTLYFLRDFRLLPRCIWLISVFWVVARRRLVGHFICSFFKGQCPKSNFLFCLLCSGFTLRLLLLILQNMSRDECLQVLAESFLRFTSQHLSHFRLLSDMLDLLSCAPYTDHNTFIYSLETQMHRIIPRPVLERFASFVPVIYFHLLCLLLGCCVGRNLNWLVLAFHCRVLKS